jgi:hypothetical protein
LQLDTLNETVKIQHSFVCVHCRFSDKSTSMATVESQEYYQGVPVENVDEYEEVKSSECNRISQTEEFVEDVSYDDSVELSLSCTLASSEDTPSDNCDHLTDDFPADGGRNANERVESPANPDSSLPVSRSGRSLRRMNLNYFCAAATCFSRNLLHHAVGFFS